MTVNLHDFDASYQPPDPPTFVIGGETFVGVGDWPAATMLGVLANPGRVPVMTIVTATLADGDLERFNNLITRKDDPVPLSKVLRLADTLLAHYTAPPRPTPPPEPSGSGRPTTGSTSPDGQPSQDTAT